MVSPNERYPVGVSSLYPHTESQACPRKRAALLRKKDGSGNAREGHLQSKQEKECLHAVEAAIHKVAHEEVVRLRAVAPDLEKLHQVIELTMDVTTCGTSVALSTSRCTALHEAACMLLHVCSCHSDLVFLLERREQSGSVCGRSCSQRVTGASTRCTLDSSTRISTAFSHSVLTCCSASGSQRFSCSIHWSRSDILPLKAPDCPSVASCRAVLSSAGPGYQTIDGHPRSCWVCVVMKSSASSSLSERCLNTQLRQSEEIRTPL